MTQIEALKLALEALEKTQSALARCIGPHKSEEGDRHRALAYSRTTSTAIKAALEAKDEPVAWMREDGTLHFADKNIFYVGQPFYTTPPQRKPLTDEEAKDLLKHSDLLDMFEHIGWYSAPKNGFNKHGISLIRAIEAAHGIKGEA